MVSPAVRIPGSSPTTPPRRPDGSAYRYELLEGQGRWRAFADDPEALLAEIVPGYAEAQDAARAEQRVRLVLDAQLVLQARLVVDLGLDGCTDDDRELLLGSRDQPPAVPQWAAAVPLVLVRSFYRPDGELPVQVERDGGRIVWLDPSTAIGVLTAMTLAGSALLAVHGPRRGS